MSTEQEDQKTSSEECLIFKHMSPMAQFLAFSGYRPEMSTFLKIMLTAMVMVLVSCAITLWLISAAMERHAEKTAAQRAEIVAALVDLDKEIRRHSIMTLENRVIQSEIRGILSQLQYKEKESKGGK